MKSYHGILAASTLAVLTLLGCICGLASRIETVTAVFPKTSAANLQWGSLQHDELTRTFAYYVPDGLPPEPVPLVFTLHGGGSNATSVWSREQGQTWKSLADQHKFILILPEGRPVPGDETSHHWNDCRMGITNPDPPSTEDDVGFINKLIDWATLNFNIDQDRICANGASNGGMMSYRLAIEGGQRFAAIAAMIANLPSPSKCTPATHPIPILIMNGTADPIMPYAGGCVRPPACDRGNVMSTTATVTYWVTVNQTEMTPSVQALPDVITDDHSTVTVYTYANGINDTELMAAGILRQGRLNCLQPGDSLWVGKTKTSMALWKSGSSFQNTSGLAPTVYFCHSYCENRRHSCVKNRATFTAPGEDI